MLKVIGPHILIKRVEEKNDGVIAKVKDDNVTRGVVILADEVLKVMQGDLVHFPQHTPQKIKHGGGDELYVIKEEDILLISRPDKIPLKKLLENNNKKGGQNK